MLKELYIENLAVIEKASVGFCGGFNVFTGETGAGKSILIGAVKAILGGRVSRDIVRSGSEKALVSAVFTDITPTAAAKLAEFGFALDEGEDELVLAREVSIDGKSAARINNRPAAASALRDIAEELIDIHGQHDSRTLTDNIHQRELVDNFAGLSGDLKNYAEVFRAFSEISKKIRLTETDRNTKSEKALLLKEKIDDVNKYKLTLGEEQDVSAKLSALQNSEEIKRNIAEVTTILSGDEEARGIGDMIRQCRSSLTEIAEYLTNCEELIKRLESAAIELDDIKGEVGGIEVEHFDRGELRRLEERMSDLLSLKRKYKMDIDELVKESEKWRDELAELEYSGDMVEKLHVERKIIGDKLKMLAEEITLKRKIAALDLAEKITAELFFLDMPNVRLFFDIRQEKVTVTGMDSVEIMISVNRGEEPKPLGKIASGGELSRIMLAIKAVLAESDSIPTMIFDEIDTGISGKAAQKVGLKIAEIAEKRQVLCVTHLASIAAKANKHLLIEKSDDGERTYTSIKDLGFDERKKEIARIISGGEDESLQEFAENIIQAKPDETI